MPLSGKTKTRRMVAPARRGRSATQAKAKAYSHSASQAQSVSAQASSQEQLSLAKAALEMGRLLMEKCELTLSRAQFAEALQLSRQAGDLRIEMEALAGLLRIAGEALSLGDVEQLQSELDLRMASHPSLVPPMAWYCKGAIARNLRRERLAQGFFHRYIRAVREDSTLQPSELQIAEVRGWVMVAVCLANRNHRGRAEWLAGHLLSVHEAAQIPGVNGTLYLLMGRLRERTQDWAEALRWYQKAHGAFLGERNWYSHLYAILGYARLSRSQKQYLQADFQLDLIDKAAGGPEFGALRRELELERERLQDDAVDVLIDKSAGAVKIREVGQVSLRKQFVLLGILEELSRAHARGEGERGLSKGELIERVWREPYRPELHDNKLYYNINRLRKLIEPDVREPRYLLNWKEGYRFSPGIKVQVIGSERH